MKEDDKVGQYIIERLLGAGGIGAVYLAHHSLLQRPVALKIHDYFSFDRAVGQAFLRASNNLFQMDHPHIVRLYDYGFQGERAYQALEYIEGYTFDRLVPPQQTRAWVDRCIVYFAQMLSALHYAHTTQYSDLDGTPRRGILHGDIKPHNIFLDVRADAVKLTDFMIPDVQALLGKGTLLVLHEREAIPSLFSTPAYMAPEQKRGCITPQTDIFNVGVTMYQLLTGWDPGNEENSPGLRNDIPAIHENPFIPVWLNNVIMTAMQHDPSQRFQTVAEILAIVHAQQAYTRVALNERVGGLVQDHTHGTDHDMYVQLSVANRRELLEALAHLKEALSKSPILSQARQRELAEIVHQLEDGVTNAESNTTLLRILSNGLVETVRAIGDTTIAPLAEVLVPLLTKQFHEQKQAPGPTRILFLAANPKDTPELRLDTEIRNIEAALRRSAFRDAFDLKQHWAVRVSDLQEYLLRYRPAIVHFSGHGSLAGEIMLEDETGYSRPVSPQALQQVFALFKDHVRCVVLNACYSEQQAQAIAQSIECVVGMSKAIGDTAATSFATAFYQALGYGQDIQTAFDLGRAQIDLAQLKGGNTPRLLTTHTDGVHITFVSDVVLAR